MFRVNHIHLRSPDPRNAAQWYVDNLQARIVSEGKGLGDSPAIRMELGGTMVTISGSPTGLPLPDGSAEYHWGLEHFGLDTDDIGASLSKLEASGVEVLLPVTQMASGALIAYVKGPDNVMIELVQTPAFAHDTGIMPAHTREHHI